MWLGPAPYHDYSPNRCHFEFRYNLDHSGGRITDWGAHHNDIAQWALGMDESGPVKIEGKGGFNKAGPYDYANYLEVHYWYGNGVELVCENEGGNGVRFQGTDEHHNNWLDCIRSRHRPAADIETGRRSASVCHLGNIAMRLGRPLQWDPDKEEFAGDAADAPQKKAARVALGM